MEMNTPFTVLADHSGFDTDGYRLKIDGSVVEEKPVSALVDGVIAFQNTAGLPRGTYAVKVSAFNVDGETESEAATLVITGQPPVAPINVRFTVL